MSEREVLDGLKTEQRTTREPSNDDRIPPGPTLPDFLIIGAMKSGSTSLARYLEAHPQVFLPHEKEIHFFDRHYEKGVDWYASRFQSAADHLVLGEATPNYLYDREAIRRIASTVPAARLIAILRNPVDRAYSHYWHERARGREKLDFKEALAAEAARLASADTEARMHCSYFDQGRYIDQLLYLTGHYPREALRVILSDDLRRAPVATFQSICRFLGVGDDPVPENVGRRYNEYVAFRSLAARDVARGLSSRGHVLRLLGRVLGRLNARRVSYPRIPRDLRAELTSRYRDANRALAAWLDRDLWAWER